MKTKHPLLVLILINVVLFCSCEGWIEVPTRRLNWAEVSATLSREQTSAWLKINDYHIERTGPRYVLGHKDTEVEIVTLTALETLDALPKVIPIAAAASTYLAIEDVIVTRSGDGNLLIHIKGVGTGVLLDTDTFGE